MPDAIGGISAEITFALFQVAMAAPMVGASAFWMPCP